MTETENYQIAVKNKFKSLFDFCIFYNHFDSKARILDSYTSTRSIVVAINLNEKVNSRGSVATASCIGKLSRNSRYQTTAAEKFLCTRL